jgi:hypothetical protein
MPFGPPLVGIDLAPCAELLAKVSKQKDGPDKSASVFKILPDCPLRWAQYLSLLQSVRHWDRATSYCFWSTST